MRLPSPPADLSDRPLPMCSVEGNFWRLWRDAYSSPLFWSERGLYRFDSKSARYGVLYTGCTFEAAVLEVFGDHWRDARRLSASLASSYRVSRLVCFEVRVVDTTGPGLNRLGVDSMLFASTHYALTQRWARAFMEHPSEPKGILYHSRKNPTLTNCAFFEPGPLPYERQDWRLLDHPEFGGILDEYAIALV